MRKIDLCLVLKQHYKKEAIKSSKDMVRWERKFYSEEKKWALTAYYNRNESVLMIARRFEVNKDTVGNWGYRKRRADNSMKKLNQSP
jgi:transposase-like protein